MAHATSAVLLGVRFGDHQDFARIVFDFEVQGPYRIVSSDASDTIWLEFPTLSRPPEPADWSGKNSLVRAIHFMAEPPTVRAEIRLWQPGYVYRHFLMTTPPRLIVDIRPGRAAESTRPPRQTPVKSEVQPQPAVARQVVSPPPTPTSPPPASAVPRPTPIADIPLTLSAEQLLSHAEHAWASQQYEMAQHAYQTFLARFPQHAQNPLIVTRLADILRVQGYDQEALETYAQVVETYPRSEGALISKIRMAELHMSAPNLLATAAAGQEQRYLPYTAPLPTLQQLIREYPFHSLADMARYTTGLLLLDRHDTAGAFDTFRQLLDRSLSTPLRQEVESKFRETLQLLITEQTEKGEYLAALRTFFTHKAVLSTQELLHPRLVRLVAQSYAGLGLLDEASHLLQMLLATGTLTPEQRAEAVLERATILLENEQVSEAKAQVAELTDFPTDALRRRARRVRGDIALHEHQPQEAARYLQPVAELFATPSEQAQTYARLAQLYADQGEYEPALQFWQRCTELASQDDSVPSALAQDCLLQTGRVHFVQQHYQQALAVYDTLLQRLPESDRRDQVRFAMAECFRELEDGPHMLEQIQALRDHAQDPFWQQIAQEYQDNAAWHEQFKERLAAFHNTLTK
jgi:tetratricopeptide (TPR) repeat protein